MKLENQVTSLELSQKLKELGVKQNSIFNWYYRSGFEEPHHHQVLSTRESMHHGDDLNVNCSAFTVAELGNLLPSYILINGLPKFLYCWKDDAGAWRIHYAQWGEMTDFFVDKCETEADARAKCLIYLIENKLIDLNK